MITPADREAAQEAAFKAALMAPLRNRQEGAWVVHLVTEMNVTRAGGRCCDRRAGEQRGPVIIPATKTRMQEWARQQVCPKCATSLDMKFIIEVKPVGSFSLAGTTMKYVATEIPILFCPNCGVESKGSYKQMSEADGEWEARMARELHRCADETNDVRDHDELHAAGALLAHDGSDQGKAYVGRWLTGLIEKNGLK